ncbi:hypothetical protein niasHT_006330 [Heterodera trifolii]|uniref:BACK domain-containing protein n=1 Tax=Heterodera trifolii TaxID=157864 RepID=A0ABD2M4K6_9BILA
MLSFIYADDLDELDGNNAMAVLYAAKKYNIPSLVDPSLQIPISELSNVFFAFAQARLFDLEDFSIKCFRYICQNAAKLFESNDFLQIDQKMLCVLLDSELLLFSDEFEIWNAALRWADEKCRQNGIECSSENRRAMLVPSGVLIEKEVISVYQFNAHPYLYRCGVPGLYSLKFPSHGRIFDWNKAKSNRRGTLALEIEKVSEFAGASVSSGRFRALGNSLYSATYRIVSEKSEAENRIGTLFEHVINRSNFGRGFENFISFAELMDPSNAFYNREEDTVTLTVDFTVKDEKMEKPILDQNKSKGTISMEIEKVSEFAREVTWSERKSESVHIKGLPWKILAEIEKKDHSTDNNEKWLGISLLCDAPKEAIKTNIGVANVRELLELSHGEN